MQAQVVYFCWFIKCSSTAHVGSTWTCGSYSWNRLIVCDLKQLHLLLYIGFSTALSILYGGMACQHPVSPLPEPGKVRHHKIAREWSYLPARVHSPKRRSQYRWCFLGGWSASQMLNLQSIYLHARVVNTLCSFLILHLWEGPRQPPPPSWGLGLSQGWGAWDWGVGQ